MKAGTCRHYNGSFHNDQCEAGICYRDVTPEPGRPEGSALRLPCINRVGDDYSAGQLAEIAKRGSCAKREEPTAEEIAESERAMQAAMDRMMKTLPLAGRIKKEHAGEDWSGVETCPVCQGRLHIAHVAYNGHTRGSCETEDCVAWME